MFSVITMMLTMLMIIVMNIMTVEMMKIILMIS